MTNDEIRKRVRGIVALANQENGGLEGDILSLAEDILGKPLEPEFDESKVVHGSVWQCGGSIVLLLERGDDASCLVASYIKQGGKLSEDTYNGPAKQVASRLRVGGYTYFGQYDFAAGLPKGGAEGQLLDEAVGLLRHWLNAPYRSLSDNTSEFLAKLEASK